MFTRKIIVIAVVAATAGLGLNVPNAMAQSEMSKKFERAAEQKYGNNVNSVNERHRNNNFNRHTHPRPAPIVVDNHHNHRHHGRHVAPNHYNHRNHYNHNNYHSSHRSPYYYNNRYYDSHNRDLAWGLGAVIVGGLIADTVINSPRTVYTEPTYVNPSYSSPIYNNYNYIEEDQKYGLIDNGNYFNGNSWVSGKGYRYLNNEVLVVKTGTELFRAEHINFLTDNHIRTRIVTSNNWIRNNRTQFDMLASRTDVFEISIR